VNWEEVVNGIGPRIYRLARRIVGHSADAEDIVGEVFLEAFQFQQHEEIRDWEALLRRMTTQRSIDRIRRRRPTSAMDADELASSSGDPINAAIAKELSVQIRKGIAELPERVGSKNSNGIESPRMPEFVCEWNAEFRPKQLMKMWPYSQKTQTASNRHRSWSLGATGTLGFW